MCDYEEVNPPRLPVVVSVASWILSELRSHSVPPIRRTTRALGGGGQGRSTEHPSTRTGQPEASPPPSARRLLARFPSDDSWVRVRGGGRRRRLGEGGLDSTSASESPIRRRAVFPLPNATSGTAGGSEEDMERVASRRPPKDGRRYVRPGGAGGWASATPAARGATRRDLSTRSADDAEEGLGVAATLESSTLSVGSPHSTMGAR